MFYHLNGLVTNISSDTVIIDCDGIGFEMTVTPGTAAALTVGSKSKLYITESTVKGHIQHIFEKAKVSNRTSLMAMMEKEK